jgi:hypothetical protein
MQPPQENASLFMDSGVIYDLISSLTYYILDKERRTTHRAFSLARHLIASSLISL